MGDGSQARDAAVLHIFITSALCGGRRGQALRARVGARADVQRRSFVRPFQRPGLRDSGCDERSRPRSSAFRICARTARRRTREGLRSFCDAGRGRCWESYGQAGIRLRRRLAAGAMPVFRHALDERRRYMAYRRRGDFSFSAVFRARLARLNF